jgi:hypothetical protein
VTAQLLYEVGGPQYPNPDVTARFDTIALVQEGPDRVAISGVRGEVPPERLKVSMNYLGGFRNTMSLVLTGLDAEAKADLALRTITGLTLAEAADGRTPVELGAASRLHVAELHVSLELTASPDPATTHDAQSHLRLTVKDLDPKKVGKAFTTAGIEAALGSYPGMFPTAPPGEGTPFGVYWPATVPADVVEAVVTLDEGGAVSEVARTPGGGSAEGAAAVQIPAPALPTAAGPGSPTQRHPLGRLVGARSGDKGGSANIGVWVPDPADHARVTDPDAAYAWLVGFLTPDRVRSLLPEAAALEVDVHPLPNLRAVNVVVHGLLGRGVADSTRLDPQAKGLGEQLRARLVDLPAALLRDEP